MRKEIEWTETSSGCHSENHGRAKLTNEDVKWIKMYILAGFTLKEIGEAFCVSLYAIYEIKSGRRWKRHGKKAD